MTTGSRSPATTTTTRCGRTRSIPRQSASPIAASTTTASRGSRSSAARSTRCSTTPRPHPVPGTASTSSSASWRDMANHRKTQRGGRLMPARTDIKSIMVLGSGPIVIGQACEFDYSGTQALKVLRKRGLPHHPGEQQPGHDHDRPRSGRPHLRRAADRRLGRRGSSRRKDPTRSSRRSAGRPD